MDLLEIKKKIDELDTNKLIDIVKNYKQYGYSEEIRKYALSVLDMKGVNREDLQLTGNLKNSNYELANELYLSFRKNSKISFISYLILVFIKLVAFRIDFYSDLLNVIGFFACFVVYILFLTKSFLNQSAFYKLTGDDYSYGALLYFFLGMPLYIVMYFVFVGQMKEKLKTVF